ncbi:cysteine-rich receptor-like protein kinase 10 [Panicum virgatum]|uniref:cysteine-rich receptor-like protein kinase 10 n=1 Tax=Panicum virgatum TaxID=38727 RepID=UPI0019D523CE|nr:cysteine-rich receptor-like protein kinase 10 [Panicum virgatum]
MAVVNILMLVVSSCFVFLLQQPWWATAIGSVCSSAGNYTANGTYQSNLVSMSRTLPGNTSSSPQAGGPDAVYALALCRSDMVFNSNPTGCSACIASAFQYAQQSCPNGKVAAVYNDNCALGFSDSSALLRTGFSDRSTLFQSWYYLNIPGGDPATVGAGVRDMLNQTALLAAARSSRFVTAFMDSSSGAVRTTLYPLAQCTPDLSATDCLACLQGLVVVLNTTTSVRLGGQIHVLRCHLKYENMRFFNDDNASMVRITPSSSVTPAPPAPTTNKTTRARPPWVIPLIVAPPVAALLYFVVFYCRRRRTRRR